MFLPRLSLIHLLLFPLSSFCIQNETDVQSKCDDPYHISKIIEEASKTFTSCLSSISEPSNKEEFYKFVCTDMAQTGYKCLNDLLENIEDECINVNLKTLSKHYVRVFNATINEQCEGGKEGFMGRAPAIENMSCQPKFVEWSVDIYQKCFPSLGLEVLLGEYASARPHPQYDLTSRIDASHACDIFRYSNIQECLFGILNETCGNRALNVYGFKLLKQGFNLCETTEPGDSYIIYTFASYAERKCYLNAGKQALQHLLSASTFKDEPSNRSSSPEAFYEVICVDLPAKFYPYLENLLDKLVYCLEPESKFLPEFVLGAFNDTIAQVCTSDETFVARIKELDNVNCDKGVTNTIFNVCLISKTNFLKNRFSIDPEIIITKPLICSELKLVIDCIKETLDTACDSVKMDRYVLSFLQPFLSSCSKDISENLI